MQLRKYDGRCVRIVDSSGETFEGICAYNSKDYNEHAYGRCEDGLKILNFLFYRSDIKELSSLEQQGPYGRFSAAYGRFEELTIEGGIDSIEDVLFSEEPEHVYRLLLCLGRYFDPASGLRFACPDETMLLLQKLLQTEGDALIREEAEKLIRLRG